MTTSSLRRFPGLPNYIVLRAAPCAKGEVPENLLGTWLDIDSVPREQPLDNPATTDDTSVLAQAVPTSTFEVNELTGEVAEVYLIHRKSTPVDNCH